MLLNLFLCAVLLICAASCRSVTYIILWAFLAGADFYMSVQSIISKLLED